MIYLNVFNCDIPNFKMYKDQHQKGLYVHPNMNLKKDLIITLCERNYKTEIYTGNYLKLRICEVLQDHKNELFKNLIYLNCKLVDKGHSDFLNGRLKSALSNQNICPSVIEKLNKKKISQVNNIKSATTSKTKT